MLVLSLFPGIDILGHAFELEGFCVVRGPDLITGGDVRDFCPPINRFDGIIGGPPCQDFSRRRRAPATGYGVAMLAEFERIVIEASPSWWLMENVDRVPDVQIDGYSWQRIDVNQSWYSGVSRLRHVQFGRTGYAMPLLDIPAGTPTPGAEPAALACDERSVEELKRLQGLPTDFDLPGMTIEAQKRAIGNGVPLVMGRVLAIAVKQALRQSTATKYRIPAPRHPEGDPTALPTYSAASAESVLGRVCGCGCGRSVRGRKSYAGVACRKRAQRRRERATDSRPKAGSTK